MRRWFKADYDDASISLWDLPFEMVEHVDPAIQSVIISEAEDQRLVFNSLRGRYQLLSRCPEACRGKHWAAIQQNGVARIIRGWHCLTEFSDPKDGGFLDVTVELVRAWKHECDKLRKESEKTDEEIERDLDEIAEKDLDERLANIDDRLQTGTRSSKVMPREVPRIITPGSKNEGPRPTLLVPRHVAEARARAAGG